MSSREDVQGPPFDVALSVAETVQRMAELLSASLGDDARHEAREILSLMHDMPRSWAVLAHDHPLSATDVEHALAAARLRAVGAPLQYAAGRAVFRQFTLDVDARVLIPRPETELLVDIVLERTRMQRGGIAVDVGTGSGAIAIALASEGEFARVVGTDVSRDALDVARSNAIRCASRSCAPIELRQGSLLGPVPERGLRAIVSNPPYIAFGEAPLLPAMVRDWEPSVALFSGGDGMTFTARLLRDAAAALASGGVLALEVDVRRAATVAELAATLGAYEGVEVLLDLTGRERFVVARRREE